MLLTDKQFEIMDLFWEAKNQMTISRLLEISTDRSWSEKSVYKIIAQLEKNGFLAVSENADINYAKSYVPAITFREYAAKLAIGMNKARKPSVRINLAEFMETLEQMEDEWEQE